MPINKDQISGIDPKCGSMTFIELHFGLVLEICSLLIGIDQQLGLMQHILKKWSRLTLENGAQGRCVLETI